MYGGARAGIMPRGLITGPIGGLGPIGRKPIGGLPPGPLGPNIPLGGIIPGLIGGAGIQGRIILSCMGGPGGRNIGGGGIRSLGGGNAIRASGNGLRTIGIRLIGPIFRGPAKSPKYFINRLKLILLFLHSFILSLYLSNLSLSIKLRRQILFVYVIVMEKKLCLLVA